MKLVFFLFNFVNRTYNKFKIETNLVEQYCSAKIFLSAKNSSIEGIRNESKQTPKITFIEYLAIRMKYSKNLKLKKKALDEVEGKLDVETILKLCITTPEKLQDSNQEPNRIKILRDHNQLNINNA